jgi:hypothetical protein
MSQSHPSLYRIVCTSLQESFSDPNPTAPQYHLAWQPAGTVRGIRQPPRRQTQAAPRGARTSASIDACTRMVGELRWGSDIGGQRTPPPSGVPAARGLGRRGSTISAR